ncbi:hypothetical protein [Polluticoccus soli]|uniref:hypothetical protein n=1 Tax=Polluticoccus soli TaxID=3034150 RepID=UPI0023E2A999|nr:hypothetical protein [Flavipsychrobacter sp. JY13-12]
MQLKLSAAALFSVLVIGFSACAQTKKTTGVKNGETYAKALQATLQRTLPGAPGMEPVNEYRILIVWKSSQTPETFFWRSEGDWIQCSIAKARAKKQSVSAQGIVYTAEPIALNKIKKNDTLELLPVPGGKYPVPSSIPETATNTIFFKTTKSAWLSLSVKNIKRAKDIVMP